MRPTTKGGTILTTWGEFKTHRKTQRSATAVMNAFKSLGINQFKDDEVLELKSTPESVLIRHNESGQVVGIVSEENVQ